MQNRNKNGPFKNHSVIITPGTYKKDQKAISGPKSGEEGNEKLLWKSTGRSDISRLEQSAIFTFKKVTTDSGNPKMV
jgi:hypothetical protein